MTEHGEYLTGQDVPTAIKAVIDPDLICEWRFVATMIPVDMPDVLERAAAALEGYVDDETATALRNYARGLRRELARKLTATMDGDSMVVNANYVATVDPADLHTASYTINAVTFYD